MREQRFPTPGPIELHCVISSGDVTVSTADIDETTVSIAGTPQLIDALRVEMTGETLTISEPSFSFRDLIAGGRRELHITATVPLDSAVECKTASGDVTLGGRLAAVTLQTASGDLRVMGEVTGDVAMSSASGDARIEYVGGELEMSSASGDLRAESVAGSVTARSMSGDVRIEALREGNVSARSASGDITLGVHSGSIVDLDARSASGELSSEIALGDAPTHADGPLLVIRAVTASGDIAVHRATPATL